ncbi:MAG: hypothetical protein GJ680_07325, partial [Alteromonadaceae bacterium]|nr:hypothetical protein [Alteromonadaceae bacterium]
MPYVDNTYQKKEFNDRCGDNGDCLDIYIYGDQDLVVSTLEAVVRLSTAPELTLLARVVFILVFLYSFIRVITDDKGANPLKEFAVGIVMWILIASPQGTKFDVFVHSMSDPNAAEVPVGDVPALAALPAYISTNAMTTIRQLLEHHFQIAGVSTQSVNSVLGALVRLYSTKPSSAALYGTGESNFDLERSMKNYVVDCIGADNDLDGNPVSANWSNLMRATLDDTLFEKVKVSANYDGIATTLFMGDDTDGFGTVTTCPAAANILDAEIKSYSPAEIAQIMGNSDPDSIEDAIDLIMLNDPSAPNAYQMQVGMFANYLLRNGMRGTEFEKEVDMMVWQGMQQRLFDNAGMAELFKQAFTPVVTIFEAFSFFISPIVVLLMVAGGNGVKHVAQYSMLIIFINLWGVVQIFVDFYTMHAIRDAIDAKAFTFGGTPEIMTSVMAELSTAGALMTTIPMLALYLLFGKVHSLMGASTGLTKGTVDPKYAAPTIESPQNNGDKSGMGYNTGIDGQTGQNVYAQKTMTDPTISTLSVKSGVDNAISTGGGIGSSISESQSSAFQQNYSNAWGSGGSLSFAAQSSSGETSSDQIAYQFGKNLQTSLANQSGIDAKEAAQIVSQIMGRIGAGADGDISKGFTAGDIHSTDTSTSRGENDFGDSITEKEKEQTSNSKGAKGSAGIDLGISGVLTDAELAGWGTTLQEIEAAIESANNQLVESQTFNDFIENRDSETFQVTDTMANELRELASQSDQIQLTEKAETAYNDSISQMQGVSSNQEVMKTHLRAMDDPYGNGNGFNIGQFYDNLFSNESLNRIGSTINSDWTGSDKQIRNLEKQLVDNLEQMGVSNSFDLERFSPQQDYNFNGNVGSQYLAIEGFREALTTGRQEDYTANAEGVEARAFDMAISAETSRYIAYVAYNYRGADDNENVSYGETYEKIAEIEQQAAQRQAGLAEQLMSDEELVKLNWRADAVENDQFAYEEASDLASNVENSVDQETISDGVNDTIQDRASFQAKDRTMLTEEGIKKEFEKGSEGFKKQQEALSTKLDARLEELEDKNFTTALSEKFSGVYDSIFGSDGTGTDYNHTLVQSIGAMLSDENGYIDPSNAGLMQGAAMLMANDSDFAQISDVSMPTALAFNDWLNPESGANTYDVLRNKADELEKSNNPIEKEEGEQLNQALDMLSSRSAVFEEKLNGLSDDERKATEFFADEIRKGNLAPQAAEAMMAIHTGDFELDDKIKPGDNKFENQELAAGFEAFNRYSENTQLDGFFNDNFKDPGLFRNILNDLSPGSGFFDKLGSIASESWQMVLSGGQYSDVDQLAGRAAVDGFNHALLNASVTDESSMSVRSDSANSLSDMIYLSGKDDGLSSIAKKLTGEDFGEALVSDNFSDSARLLSKVTQYDSLDEMRSNTMKTNGDIFADVAKSDYLQSENGNDVSARLSAIKEVMQDGGVGAAISSVRLPLDNEGKFESGEVRFANGDTDQMTFVGEKGGVNYYASGDDVYAQDTNSGYADMAMRVNDMPASMDDIYNPAAFFRTGSETGTATLNENGKITSGQTVTMDDGTKQTLSFLGSAGGANYFDNGKQGADRMTYKQEVEGQDPTEVTRTKDVPEELDSKNQLSATVGTLPLNSDGTFENGSTVRMSDGSEQQLAFAGSQNGTNYYTAGSGDQTKTFAQLASGAEPDKVVQTSDVPTTFDSDIPQTVANGTLPLNSDGTF